VNYRICTRCVMDITDPTIVFSEDGVCNHCAAYRRAFESKVFFGVKQTSTLDEVVAEVKRRGRGKLYDCIIGLSGGVDSSYVAWRVRQLGLRPLAVHVDNGWNSELAVANIENICRELKIDLKTEVLNWPEFRDLQLAFLKASTPDAEIASDHAIVATMYRTSRSLGVPVIAGYNARTESHMPAAWSQGHFDSRYIRAVHRAHGTVQLRTFPMLNWLQGQHFVRRLFNILNYISYNKSEAISTVTNELGWRNYGRKHSESVYTKFFQEYYLPRKFGFDKRRSHLSSLINAGEVTREAALEELRAPACTEQEGRAMVEFVQKKLQISPAEFAKVEGAVLRRFEDFDSYARLQRSRGAAVARWLYRNTLKEWL
jgi:N-acetyl sugar amidotransferase